MREGRTAVITQRVQLGIAVEIVATSNCRPRGIANEAVVSVDRTADIIGPNARAATFKVTRDDRVLQDHGPAKGADTTAVAKSIAIIVRAIVRQGYVSQCYGRIRRGSVIRVVETAAIRIGGVPADGGIDDVRGGDTRCR